MYIICVLIIGIYCVFAVIGRMAEGGNTSDVDLNDGQGRITGSTAKSSKGKNCFICRGKFTHIRRHVITCHLPWYTVPHTSCWQCRIPFGQWRFLIVHLKEVHDSESDQVFQHDVHGEDWIRMMNGCFQEILDRLNLKTLDDLCNKIKSDEDFLCCQGAVYQNDDLNNVALYCHGNNFKTDLNSSVYPDAGLRILLHWKILAILIRKTGIPLSFYREVSWPVEAQPESKIISYIDSHFHLDVFCRRVGCSDLSSLDWPDKDRDIQYELKFAIANFCYPDLWPSSSQRDKIREDERIRLTFGIHPRIVSKQSTSNIQKWIKDIEHFLLSKKVVGVGECGVDTMDDPSTYEIGKQLYVLEKLATLARNSKLPLVIHCRADKENTSKCLKTLQNILPSSAKIHRHCFAGDEQEYREWKYCFPNIKFGVSPLILVDNGRLRELFCGMDINDLILETDAPYLKEEGETYGTPFLVQKIASKLANLQNLDSKEVARKTSLNATELYNLS